MKNKITAKRKAELAVLRSAILAAIVPNRGGFVTEIPYHGGWKEVEVPAIFTDIDPSVEGTFFCFTKSSSFMVKTFIYRAK